MSAEIISIEVRAVAGAGQVSAMPDLITVRQVPEVGSEQLGAARVLRVLA